MTYRSGYSPSICSPLVPVLLLLLSLVRDDLTLLFFPVSNFLITHDMSEGLIPLVNMGFRVVVRYMDADTVFGRIHRGT